MVWGPLGGNLSVPCCIKEGVIDRLFLQHQELPGKGDNWAWDPACAYEVFVPKGSPSGVWAVAQGVCHLIPLSLCHHTNTHDLEGEDVTSWQERTHRGFWVQQTWVWSQLCWLTSCELECVPQSPLLENGDNSVILSRDDKGNPPWNIAYGKVPDAY